MTSGDLFGAGAGTGADAAYPALDLPLAVRMRPRSLAEVRGQEAVLRVGSPLRRLVEGSSGPAGPLSAILWGPPGTGKTTLAHLVAGASGRRFVELSAVTAGVKDVREVMAAATRERDLYGRHTVLFLDEIHRFNKAQQDALLPGVENRTVTLDPDATAHLVRMAGGDARRSLTALEAAAGVAGDQVPLGAAEPTRDTPTAITLAHVERAMAQAAVRYDRAGDQHYDVASALIKSMRGSDVDAALHYLARMLEAGEDPRFVARRIVIAASEDVGMADPTALQTAVAAMHAVAQIGMPEARIVLAQAVVHVTLAPKSNAAYLGIDAAIADVRAGRGGPVPLHLRGSGYAGSARVAASAAAAGAGPADAVYRYAHDAPEGVATQQYLPDDLSGRVDYYRPTGRGFEERLATRWTWLKGLLRG